MDQIDRSYGSRARSGWGQAPGSRAAGLWSMVPVLAGLILMTGCGSAAEPTYYTAADYEAVPKFNAHVHLYENHTTFIEQAVAHNFSLLNFISSSPGRTETMPIEVQEEITLEKISRWPDHIFMATTIRDPYSFNEPDWVEETIAHLEQAFEKGAVAVKIRKSIGMEVRRPDGSFVTIDDPKFDPVLDFISDNDITLIGHIGEPKNCWLPLEEMTVGGDRQYYSENPQYHMYLHPEYLAHEDHIRAVENMLEKHPDLRYVGAHLASLEYDVDELAKRLERFPNMAVDMAERISHFQYQAVENREKVRDFLIRYQDRLIYATDESSWGPKPHFGAELTDQTQRTPAQIAGSAEENWKRHWKFFTSGEVMTAPKLPDMEFRGLELPREVIDKIYFRNAERWFPGIVDGN